jgi:hypothetical protein
MRLLATILSILLVGLPCEAFSQAMTVSNGVQIILNCTPDEGCEAKLAFENPTRYDAWRLDWGDGVIDFIAGSEPASHFYERAGSYVLVATIYFPDRPPLEVQKAIEIQPLGSPVARMLKDAERFALQVGGSLIAIFLVLQTLGIIKVV